MSWKITKPPCPCNCAAPGISAEYATMHAETLYYRTYDPDLGIVTHAVYADEVLDGQEYPDFGELKEFSIEQETPTEETPNPAWNIVASVSSGGGPSWSKVADAHGNTTQIYTSKLRLTATGNGFGLKVRYRILTTVYEWYTGSPPPDPTYTYSVETETEWTAFAGTNGDPVTFTDDFEIAIAAPSARQTITRTIISGNAGVALQAQSYEFGAANSKHGFATYISGASTPLTVYLKETASGGFTPGEGDDSDPKSYSGYQEHKTPSASEYGTLVYPNPSWDFLFSEQVFYWSPFTPGSSAIGEGSTVDLPKDYTRTDTATTRTLKKGTDPNADTLILTLSNPYTTAALKAPVDALATGEVSYDSSYGYEQRAIQHLSPDEMFYIRWRVKVNVTWLAILFALPDATTASATLAWDEYTQNLTTGVVVKTARTASVTIPSDGHEIELTANDGYSKWIGNVRVLDNAAFQNPPYGYLFAEYDL